jgi:hypothetical protein
MVEPAVLVYPDSEKIGLLSGSRWSERREDHVPSTCGAMRRSATITAKSKQQQKRPPGDFPGVVPF